LYLYIYIYPYTYTYALKPTRTHSHTRTFSRILPLSHTHTNMSLSLSLSLSLAIPHTHAHTHTHTYTHTHTHTHTVETPLPVCYFSIGPRYGNNHIVISILRTDAKVAYQSGRLHKNTFRGTRGTSVRIILTECLFPRLLCGEGRLVGEIRPDGWTSLGARNRTRNLPRPWRFLWRRPDRYATLASVRSIEITIWLFPYLGPMLK